MRFVDTNFLARLFLNDDPHQGRKAIAFLKKTRPGPNALLVTDLVFGEFIWLIHKSKKLTRQDVTALGKALLGDERFIFENGERLARAIRLFSEYKVDFTDAYLAATANNEKSDTVISFDRDFELLPVAWQQP